MVATVSLQNATNTPGVSARFTSVELSEKPITTPATASAPNVLAPSRRLGADSSASAPPLTIALRPLPTTNTGPIPKVPGLMPSITTLRRGRRSPGRPKDGSVGDRPWSGASPSPTVAPAGGPAVSEGMGLPGDRSDGGGDLGEGGVEAPPGNRRRGVPGERLATR
jgi:hypothetical protein